ncbi:hypothetical protein [Pedobacter miscanthi]|jgi:hypothetical protein|uniref:hypothetical protein n=1 Tax=Pedobacter miscanthi TaxID=2259170 RepID=UPI002931CF8F|nr:hypothetical protein [Pedobacter miscanthi]
MLLKEYLRLIEKPFLIAYASLWVLVYVMSRFFLEIYSDHAPSSLWWWSLLVILPISLYAAARTTAIKRENWYGVIGYFIMYSLLGLFTSNYMIVNGDILVSSAINTESSAKAEVTEVRKVFYRSGFDHTSVKLKTITKDFSMQGRPYIFFYLNGRKSLSIRSASSFLGNDYVFTNCISRGEKVKARWLHFKDQIYRAWIFIGIMLVLILIGFLAPQNFRKSTGAKPIKMGFWKMMGIVMGIVFALGLLLYIGLFVYVKFFTNSHF